MNLQKTLFICMTLVFSNFLFSQDSIRVTKNGFTTGVIKKIAYSRSIEWVNETYKNPDKVITGKVESKSLTIKAYSSNAWSYKNLGILLYYDMEYNIYITIQDSIIQFNIVEGKHYTSNHDLFLGSSSSFFKSSGEYRPMYNTAKQTLEETLNSLWFSYQNKIQNSVMSSDEALNELKKAKDKLDLGLITQEEYDKLKEELSKLIK